jgi:tetratricopeptide (TPR) repeat protein
MKIGRWVLAFTASSALAAAMVAATLPSENVRPRSAAELTDVEIDLLITRLRQGDLLAIRKDLQGARRAWDAVRRQGAGIWTVHEGLGDSLRRAGLGAEALREYGVAAELAPPGPAVASLAAKRGRVLKDLDRPLEAARAYLEGDPQAHVEAFLALARRAGAPEVMRICRERAEFDPRVWDLLGDLAARFRDPGLEAEARTQFFVRVAPWDGRKASFTLDSLAALGRSDLALEVCRAWAKAAPAATEPWKRMGDLLHAAGRDKEAWAAYTSIVDVRPGQPDAHRALADIFIGLGRREEAAAQLEAIRRARPEEPQIWIDLIALCGETRGDRLAMEAAERFPAHPAFRTRGLEALRRDLGRLLPEEAIARRRALALKGLHELGLYDLKVMLSWDVDGDVDLDVQEPGGELVFHGHASSSPGGRYYVDDIRGRGPETYTLAAAPKGTYQVGIHLHGDRHVTARVEIVLFEGTSKERRWTETATLDKGGEKRLFAPFDLR